MCMIFWKTVEMAQKNISGLFKMTLLRHVGTIQPAKTSSMAQCRLGFKHWGFQRGQNAPETCTSSFWRRKCPLRRTLTKDFRWCKIQAHLMCFIACQGSDISVALNLHTLIGFHGVRRKTFTQFLSSTQNFNRTIGSDWLNSIQFPSSILFQNFSRFWEVFTRRAPADQFLVKSGEKQK